MSMQTIIVPSKALLELLGLSDNELRPKLNIHTKFVDFFFTKDLHFTFPYVRLSFNGEDLSFRFRHPEKGEFQYFNGHVFPLKNSHDYKFNCEESAYLQKLEEEYPTSSL